MSMRALLEAYSVLRRKLRTFKNQVSGGGIGQTMARTWARLNKLEIVQTGVRGRIVRWRVREIKGPAGAPPGPDEVVVVSVMRNGLPWLHTFFTHHRQLGARHFVVLDNGSTDGTVEYLMAQDDVLLLTSAAPYQHYENTFKRYLCDRYASGRWCLFVDVDELLAYPGMERRSLDQLARFTHEQGFNGVVTQMLDLFADGPMSEMPEGSGQDIRTICRLYETQDIERGAYLPHESTAVPDGIVKHAGGVRRRVFGTNNNLTKVSLFFNGEDLVPFYIWHHVRNARLADFTVALLHFPFNRQYRAKVLEAASSGRYGWVTTDEYRGYASVMRDNPGLVLVSPASRRYEGPEQLVAEGFLQASAAFAAWAGMTI